MQSFVTLCRSSLAYVAGAGAGAFGGPILLGAEVPCSEESPSSSGSLCIAERGGAFLQEQGAIAAKFGIV